MNAFEQARIEDTEYRITSEEIEEAVVLETDPLIGTLDDRMLPARPNSWIRKIKTDRGSPASKIMII